MRRFELLRVVDYLKIFKKISAIQRVGDNIIRIVFDRQKALFFDLRRGDSHIFLKDDFKKAKIYKAPFDVVLSKKFTNSNILNMEVLKDDRILKIDVLSNSKYKSDEVTLQLEFTGKNTNAIILDKNGIVLEALRHIDSLSSYREVQTGVILKALHVEHKFSPKPGDKIEDIEKFLANEYEKRAKNSLASLKKQKIANIEKKIKKLQKLLNSLQNEEELLTKSETYALWGTLIFSNIDKIKGYEKNIELVDFEGESIVISLPKEARSGVEAGNILFDASKKLKRKAKSLYIERENLGSKIEFFKKLQNAINQASDEVETNILYPKQKHQKRAQGRQVPYESFYIEGFKMMLGKNEKGNIELLKEAKKRDIWLHLKDMPSSHVIIRTDKQNIPKTVLEFAAKLCVEFSVSQKGSYLVDYTQRRNVKIDVGAHVNYVDYKTISTTI
ncbi:MAG: NFACT RNA binding domain-containing protein [Sulfurospirillum sp.]